MNRTSDRSNRLPPVLRLLALAALPVLLVMVFLSPVGAQQPTGSSTPAATIALGEGTPAATVEPTPDLSVKTVVRIEVDAQTKPIPSGQEFEARVMIDNVEHLAGFSFTISYDPKRLEPIKPSSAEITPELTPQDTPVAGLNGNPVKNRALGDILASSPRKDGVICSGPVAQNSAVAAACVTRFPPICLGGAVGASGSGLLGAVYFKSKGGGPTTLTLAASDLVLDDVQPPCDPVDFQVQAIPNRRENVTIDLAKGGSSSTLLAVIIGVVVVVIIGGAGYLWYRRRQAPSSV
jgi:LPXTG-motif cell wall-anchored protein